MWRQPQEAIVFLDLTPILRLGLRRCEGCFFRPWAGQGSEVGPTTGSTHGLRRRTRSTAHPRRSRVAGALECHANITNVKFNLHPRCSRHYGLHGICVESEAAGVVVTSPSGPFDPSGPSVWVTILAGGSGQRFWPLSTRRRPKQLLPLASARPLIAETLERLRGLVPLERIRVLAGTELAGPIRSATGLPESAFLVEPRVKGTGPVLAWAAWEVAHRDAGAVMVSLHSDHVIDPVSRFRDAVGAAVEIAVRENLLMTIAVPPDRPETGYGYLRPGDPLRAPPGHRAYRVAGFVEKPDAETAAGYMEAGYRWNSGIFVWPARTFLAEAREHAPEIARALPRLDSGDVEAFFEEAGSISVDESILERSTRVGSLDATFAWDDLGTWESLARHRDPDARGNVTEGDVHCGDASGNIAVADSGRLVLLGVRDLVVVQTERATLVMPRSQSAELKRYLRNIDATPESGSRKPPGPGSG